MMFEFSTAAAAYCVLVAVAFLSLWLFYDRRDHLRFDRERIDCDAECKHVKRQHSGNDGAMPEWRDTTHHHNYYASSALHQRHFSQSGHTGHHHRE